MANINLDLLLDVKGSLKELEKLNKDAAKALNGIEKEAKQSTDAIKKGFDGLGTINFAATLSVFKAGIDLAKGLANALSAPIKAATEFNDAINGVRVALRLSGIESENAVQSFVRFAGEIQRTTRFSDDAVLSTGSLIASLSGLSGKGLERATTAALDLATALRIDLNAASTLIGKAAAGNVSAFSRYGIAIKTGKDATETFANTLKAIEGRFGGSSVQAVNTFGGAVDQLKNNFDDAIKTIGLSIIENEAFLESIKTLSVEVVKFIEALDKRAVSDFATALSGLVNITGKLTGIFAGLVSEGVSFTSEFGRALGIFAKQTADIFLTGGKNARFFDAELKALRVQAVNAGDDFVQLAQAARDFADQDASIQKQIEVELRAKFEAETKEIQKNLAGLTSQLSQVSKGTAAFAKEQLDTQQKTLKDGLRIGEITRKEFQDLSIRNQQQYQKELERLEKEGQERRKKLIQDAISSPVSTAARRAGVNVEGPARSESQTEQLGVAAGFATSILQGANGAKKLIVEGAAIAGQAFLGIPKEVSGPILEIFAQGPEAVKGFVKEFIASVPIIIENIIASIPELIIAIAEGIPVLIEKLIEAIPRVIDGLIAALPRVITALSEAGPQLAAALIRQAPNLAINFSIELAKQAPNIAISFAKGFIEQAPTIAKALIDAVKGIPGQALGSVGKAAGGFLSGIGKFFGFADGGQVPGGAPFIDRVPAVLTPGEQVIDRSLSQRLDNFLSSQGNSNQAQNITINLRVGEQELAGVLLNLNKRGFRTA